MIDAQANSIYTITHATRLLPAISLPPAIDSDALLQLARESRLVVRRPRKLQPLNFLSSCLLAVSCGTCSLRCQAILAGLFGAGITLSKQALHKRMGNASAIFMANVLARLLSARVQAKEICRGPFGRILVQDSTCLSLPQSLLSLFPGASNALGRSACARIQCVVELLSERFIDFSIAPFTRNDQSASSDLLDLLRPDDLILRDLGYFCISVLERIGRAGAFFITRWQYGTSLLDPGSGNPIDLLRLLDRGRPLDIRVLLGKNDKMPVRLIAFPLPQHIADSRRRKARADRDRRTNHSKEFLALLSWNFFLTNADQNILPPKHAARLYRLRWRIEILFKSWKSHLGLSSLAKVGTRQIKTLLCAQLLLALLLHHSLPVAAGTFSVLNLAQFFSLFLLPIALASLAPSDIIPALADQIRRHCRYESRKRPNYMSLKESFLC